MWEGRLTGGALRAPVAADKGKLEPQEVLDVGEECAVFAKEPVMHVCRQGQRSLSLPHFLKDEALSVSPYAPTFLK